MNKAEVVERMIISSMSEFKCVSESAKEHQRKSFLKMRPDELVFAFNHCSRDCRIEHLGGNEYIIKVNHKMHINKYKHHARKIL